MTCEAPSSSRFSASCLQLLVLTSVLDAEYGLDVNGTRRGTEYMLTNILESPYSLKMFRCEYENERKQSSVVSRKKLFLQSGWQGADVNIVFALQRPSPLCWKEREDIVDAINFDVLLASIGLFF